MELETAIGIMLESQDKLRSKAGVTNPDFISQQMQILAQATAAVEVHLANYERQYEIEMGSKLHHYLVTEGTSASNAEKRVRIELAKTKGEIAYLSRIVSSAWKQVSTAQSRWNHINTEYKTGRTIT